MNMNQITEEKANGARERGKNGKSHMDGTDEIQKKKEEVRSSKNRISE